MATFRAALTQLSIMNINGVRNNYDLAELPNSMHSAQLPALLVMPIELERERLFRRREDSLQDGGFQRRRQKRFITARRICCWSRPATPAWACAVSCPVLVDLIDNYTAGPSQPMSRWAIACWRRRASASSRASTAMASATSSAAPSAITGCWKPRGDAMTISYSVAIDRDNDGQFASVIDQDVLELRWRLGLRRAYDSMADTSWARVTVRNPLGAFFARAQSAGQRHARPHPKR